MAAVELISSWLPGLWCGSWWDPACQAGFKSLGCCDNDFFCLSMYQTDSKRRNSFQKDGDVGSLSLNLSPKPPSCWRRSKEYSQRPACFFLGKLINLGFFGWMSLGSQNNTRGQSNPWQMASLDGFERLLRLYSVLLTLIIHYESSTWMPVMIHQVGDHP